MKKFVLSRETHNSEQDKYEYYAGGNTSIDKCTPFLDKAMVFTEGEEVEVATRGWEAVWLTTAKKRKQHQQ